MRTIKCKNADSYKAIRAPKCGCDICSFKWRISNLERRYKALAEKLGDAEDSANYAGQAASAALYVANLSN